LYKKLIKFILKKIIYILFLLRFCIINAQVGMGTPNPKPDAVLDLNSSTKGFLPPRMTTVQRDAILSPATGLFVYNTDKNCLEWYNGTLWYSSCGTQLSSGGFATISSFMNCSTDYTGTLYQWTLPVNVTQTITVNVSSIGSYNLTAAASNGVTFKGAGKFTSTGIKDVVLTATGTVLGTGVVTFTLTTTPNCSFVRTLFP
jgi:hypothetical protein